MIRSLIVLVSIFVLANVVIAGPRVDIVIGEKAPALERLAADELSSQLKRVYEADVKIGSTAPADSPHVVFLGSPVTNANMKPFADSWPSGDKKLTDQGHLLRSVMFRDRSALLIGGGSPVATYWAVSEFGHRLGVRSMLFGDLDPAAPPEFKLERIDEMFEPNLRKRCWHFSSSGPSDSGAWGLEEFQHVLRQLAKLKFNCVSVSVQPWAPFVHYEYSGVQRREGEIWRQEEYPVSGDTLGRKVFGGAKFFENPDFAGLKTYEQRISAGTKLLSGVVKSAHDLGMTVSFELSIREFPKEFASVLPVGQETSLDGVSTISRNLSGISKDKKLAGLVQAQWRAYLDTYPTLDAVDIRFPVVETEIKAVQELFRDSTLRRHANGGELEIRRLRFPKETAFVPLINDPDKSRTASSLYLVPLYSTNLAVPTLRTDDLVQFLNEAKRLGADGFKTGFASEEWPASDHDFEAHLVSRMCWNERLKPLKVVPFLDTVCGTGVDDRVMRAFLLIEEATALIQKSDSVLFGWHSPGAWKEFHDSNELPPAWWGKVRDNYLDAMNEMYRANTRAREGGRSFTLYWARRCEFAFEYVNCAEAIRKAGIAERKKDTATQIAELEKAIESLNNGLNALAAVARNNSDRGLIAVLNENGYRPLKKKLMGAEEAAK